jgi:hypothetical protein
LAPLGSTGVRREVCTSAMGTPKAAPSRAGGFAAVVAQIRAERLRLLILRLSFVGVVAIVGVFLAWALPWVPLGLASGDYNAVTAIALILAAAASISVQLFIFVWTPQFHQDPFPEFLRVLMGAHHLIRGAQQFRSRLAAECRRGRSDRRNQVSLIVVQVPNMKEPASEGREPMEVDQPLAPLVVRSSMRAQDVVAVSWPNEVWVLAVAAGREAREGITKRLAAALARSELARNPEGGCLVGGSTLGEDGEDPDTLFSVARERLEPVIAPAEDAAAA